MLGAFARWLIVVFVFATSGVLPAFAWAQPADPCAVEAPAGDHDHEDGDCATSCVCPCCPVRVTFRAEPLLTLGELPQADDLPPNTHAVLLAGTSREIFHPPSR